MIVRGPALIEDQNAEKKGTKRCLCNEGLHDRENFFTYFLYKKKKELNIFGRVDFNYLLERWKCKIPFNYHLWVINEVTTDPKIKIKNSVSGALDCFILQGFSIFCMWAKKNSIGAKLGDSASSLKEFLIEILNVEFLQHCHLMGLVHLIKILYLNHKISKNLVRWFVTFGSKN